jgi:hypothetical protein
MDSSDFVRLRQAFSCTTMLVTLDRQTLFNVVPLLSKSKIFEIPLGRPITASAASSLRVAESLKIDGYDAPKGGVACGLRDEVGEGEGA